MKKFVLLAGIALLAACSQKEEAAAPEATASESMPMDAGTASAAAMSTGPQAGKYDVTNPDGTKTVTEIMADGTYQDWVDGKATEKGTWAVKDGKTCFDAEGDAAELCYSDGAQNADGSFEAIGADGKVTKVKPQAKT